MTRGIDRFGFIILLFSTLQGVYFTSIGVAPLTLLAGVGVIFMSILISRNDTYSLQGIYSGSSAIVGFYFLTFISSVLSLIYFGDNPDLKRMLAYLLVIMVAVAAPVFFKYINIEYILRMTLICHFTYFYIQFILYYQFQVDFDLIGNLTGQNQKGWGGSFSTEGMGHVRRLGGMFNEPGSYATFISPITAIFLNFYSKNLFNKMVAYLSLASIILSFSVFGFIFASLMFIAIMLSYKGKEIVFLTVSYLLCLSVTLPYFTYRFIDRNTAGLDTGLSFRETFISELMTFLGSGPYEFLFGTGLISTSLDDKVNLIGAVNDTSIFLALILNLGVILPTVFVSYLALLNLKKKEYFCLIALIIIFLSKLSIFYIFFPIILTFTFMQNNSSIDREKY